MFRLFTACAAALGLAAAILGILPPVNTAEPDKTVRYPLQQYKDAGKLICAWKPGKAAEVVKACEDLGLEIVGGNEKLDYVSCKWGKALDAQTLDALVKNKAVDFVEPIMARSAVPIFSKGDTLPQEGPKKDSQIFLPDKALEEINKSGKLICAWREGKSGELLDFVKDDLKLTVQGGSQKGEYLTCDVSKTPLTKEQLAKLLDHPSLQFVEPAYERSASGDKPKPVPDNKVEPKGVDKGATSFVLNPHDPLFEKLYGMRSIRAPEAWRTVQVSPIIVAVADTGVDYEHEDLQANMWRNPKPGAKDLHGVDFIDSVKVAKSSEGKVKITPGNDPMDRNFHGTHVAGTVGAVGNNNLGVTGVCWKVQIMAIRILNKDGRGDQDGVTNALIYATDNGAKVVNFSLSGRTGRSKIEEKAIDYAREKGVMIICAAGNEAPDDKVLDNDVEDDAKGVYPANYQNDNLIAVANIDSKEKLNPGSHFGKKTVHIGAPGTDVVSTFPMKKTEGMLAVEKNLKIELATKYSALSGTSMATPHVAGALALCLGHPDFKDKSALWAKKFLLEKARPLPALEGKCVTNGTLDISALGQGAKPPPNTPPVIDKPPHIIIYPPPNSCPQYPHRTYGRHCQ